MEALRSARGRLTPLSLATLIGELAPAGLSQSTLVTYFQRAFPLIPLRILLEAGAWTRVSGGGMTDDEFNDHLAPWLAPSHAPQLCARKRTHEMIEQWRSFGLTLPPAATPAELAELQAVVGVALPEDAVALYTTSNGMMDYDFDRWFISFWSSARLLREHEVREGTDKHGPFREVSFADVMISSWYFWYRVRGDGVVSVFAEATSEELPSFSAFVERYLDDPGSLCLVEVTPY